jgi:hypothetical protein
MLAYMAKTKEELLAELHSKKPVAPQITAPEPVPVAPGKISQVRLPPEAGAILREISEITGRSVPKAILFMAREELARLRKGKS